MTKTSLPVVRIKDAWLLRENVSVPLNELWGKGEALRSDEEYLDIVNAYVKAWQPIETEILQGLSDILGLKFSQNIIDVYIAPWFHAFSDPMVIGVIFKPDVFIDTLTHELVHRLLTDNTTIPYHTNILEPEWKKLFGKNHSFTTLVHIPVHAVHKAIYLDVLKQPKRLRRDIKANSDHSATDYVAAWDYVEKHGYMEIIEKLKKSYTQLAKEQK